MKIRLVISVNDSQYNLNDLKIVMSLYYGTRVAKYLPDRLQRILTQLKILLDNDAVELLDCEICDATEAN